MKKILSSVLEACILLCCLSIALGQTTQKPLENVFTLELQFGDKDVPSEYLLARPYRIAVNDAGDIYVFDELKVKVYDKNGKPKTIFGGKGEGPGEFTSSPITFFISPTGWLTISERQYYTLYSPASIFDKKRYSSSPVFNSLKNDYKIDFERTGPGPFPNTLIALDEKEFIILGNTAFYNNYNEENEYYDYLFRIIENKISVLANYRKVETFTYKTQSGGGSRGISYLGKFYFAVISGSKILYTHTFHDVKFFTNTAQLTFHIVSPVSNAVSEFSVTYQLEEIQDSEILPYTPSYQEKFVELSDEAKDMFNRIVNALKQRKYKPPFTEMQSDGAYIFLMNSKKENGKTKYYISVVNSESGKEVNRFITSEYLFLHAILKNGCRYVLTNSKDGYPVVQKYRIDPRVYGK